MIPVVLFFQSSARKSWRDKLAGVYRYACKTGWQVQVFEASSSIGEIRDALALWQPIGCIMNREIPGDSSSAATFSDIPTVFLDQKPWLCERRFCCVTHESGKTAELAAEEFLKTGVRDFAYVPWPQPAFWSDEREQAFAAAIRKAGRTYHGRVSASDLPLLPRPCGLFCANDIVAQQAMTNAGRLGLKIPDELLFISVDNDELICEHTRPPLTSILPDFEQAGFMVAESLDLLLKGQNPPSRTYGPRSIVRRASSRWLPNSNPLAAKALDFIARHYLDPQLRTDDIVAAMGCSRRLADLRFRAATGHSMREEIQNLRLERAFALLRNANQAIAPVANLCGYASEPFFKRLFRRKTGMSMREWRKAFVESAPDALTARR